MKAVIYDKMMEILEKKILFDIRSKLIAESSGDVLEIGAGTGINFKFYTTQTVTAIEPDEAMRKAALEKTGEKPIEVIDASAEDIPAESNTFDTVIVTLAFCTIPSPELALKEIKRVCRPGGKLLIIEHVRNEKKYLADLQDILTPAWKKFAMGCHLNRDTIALIEEKGFKREYADYFLGDNFVVASFNNAKHL